MSAVNGAGKTTWSTCSVREFNAFLLQLDESGRGNCLRDPAAGILSHDHLRDGRFPGQRFTADQQCSYFWGRDYTVEIPNGRAYEDICRILWCGNNGSTISTAHPALEGSWCGGKKWCHEGRCEPWTLPLPAPQVVDGEWSDWSSAEKQCPITPCQITGSIALKTQLRTCTNPAPNNGGKICSGMNVRGLLCGQQRTICEGFTRQEFGDRLCTAIRNDPTRPDRQLSGQSFSHATQPCKIWCHVRDSELIRNKGQFPNGSPCGPEQYCVSGSCLSLACTGEAVVADNSDCPPASGAKTKSSSNKWDAWSTWSPCSVSCGDHGVQKRTRKCRSPDSECAGKSSEVRPCEPIPPRCEEYSPWGEWSECPSTCGPAQKRHRMRSCLSGLCSEKLIDEEDCPENKCPVWSEWEQWSSCSAHCGQGKRLRSRACAGGECPGEKEQVSSCFEKVCHNEGWSEWSSCSVSCGIGFQLRERRCKGKLCSENAKQARTCNVQDCSHIKDNAVLSEWSLWGACSATCGQGFQYRHRRCLNGICSPNEVLTEQKRCVLGPCPEWSLWGNWSSCASCSVFETRKRSRKCTVKVTAGSGKEDRETEVGQESCSGAPTEFDTCERSCLELGTTPSVITVPQKGDSLWSEWENWSDCSKPCNGGRQMRSRKCLASLVFLCDGYAKEERPCNTKPCAVKNEPDNEIALPIWSEWSGWSSCSCFTLTKFRRRYCKIRDPSIQGFCSGAILEQRACEPTSCVAENGGWSDWSEWSRCSKECGSNGHQVRNRMCSNPLPSNRGSYCVGYSFDQRPCEPHSTCGTSPIDGQWAEWTPWSDCSDPCINGQRSRTRYCSNPRPQNGGLQCIGSDFELAACSEPSKCLAKSDNTTALIPMDGRWGSWSDWSLCPTTCGFSFQWRQRICDTPAPSNGGQSCHGLAYMTSVCRTNPCPDSVDGNWTAWAEWSECSSNCEESATRTRVRECSQPAPRNGGLPCFGRHMEVSKCPFNTTLAPDQINNEPFCSTSTWLSNIKLIEATFPLNH
ncbi:thrombospondin type 1 domain-containing protein [Ditylenchus destructor]|nr:thrombospondin type 1 domain-containing protein [Ditylenchus destructor]